MKIFVSAPNENREVLSTFFTAVEDLTKDGHKLVDIYKNEPVPIPDDVNYLVSKYKQSEKAIRDADVVLVDVTFPGRRIGFELARALDEKKFAIALYDEKANVSARRIAPLLGNTSKNIFYSGYNDKNIKALINKALVEAAKQLDTKFILIISPQIDKYLEWVASERRKHKAQIVREALETQMSKDKEYLAFLKDMEKGN